MLGPGNLRRYVLIGGPLRSESPEDDLVFGPTVWASNPPGVGCSGRPPLVWPHPRPAAPVVGGLLAGWAVVCRHCDCV